MACNGVVIIAMEYPPFVRGGLGTHVAILTRELAARKVPVYVFAYSPDPFPPRKEENVTIVTVSTDKRDYSRYSRDTLEHFYEIVNDRLYSAAANFFRTSKVMPTVIHCHDFHGYPASSRLRDLLQIPLICTIHLLHEPLMRWGGEEPPKTHIKMEKMMCIGSDRLIAVCSGFRDLVREKYPESLTPIHVIHNGIETHLWEQPDQKVTEQIRASFGQLSETVIVFAGRFTAQKSIVQVIEAAFYIQAERDDVTYLLAGYFENADYARAVRSALRQFPIEPKRLRILGKLPRQGIRNMYAIADIALVPSLYEGVPYAALEAMAAGVPVIGSDTCGITDLIEHRRSGLLVPVVKEASGDIQENSCCRAVDTASLVAAQSELINDESLSVSLAEQGRTRVVDLFTIDDMVDRTIAVYGT
jgi:starch synthase